MSRRKKRLQAQAKIKTLVRHGACLWHLKDRMEDGKVVSACGEIFRPGRWDEMRALEERDTYSPGRALLCEICVDAIQAERVAEAMMER